MKVVGLIPSINGFGHTRRLLSIANELTKNNVVCTFLLPCLLSKQSAIPKLIAEYGFRSKIVCFRDYTDGPYSIINSSHDCNTNPLNLNKFDYLLADTVTWVADFHDNVYLIAQFTWEQFKPKINKISIDRRLTKFKRIYGFKYFTTNYIESQTNYEQIPLLDYWGLGKYIKTNPIDKFVLANNGAQDPNFKLRDDIFLKSLDLVKGLEKYLELNTKPLAMICRPGLGAILECLSSGIAPVLFETHDPELSYNRQVALANGWAVDYKKIEPLTTIQKIDFVRNYMTHFERPTLVTSDILIDNYMGKLKQ